MQKVIFILIDKDDLFFTQIIKQEHYHYKTNKQLIEDITEEERIKTVIDEFIINGDLHETAFK